MEEFWDSRIGPFTEQYKDYRTSETGLYLAASNIRNHMSVKKMQRANPDAELVTELFTPQTVDSMLLGRDGGAIENNTRYDYLLILRLAIFHLWTN